MGRRIKKKTTRLKNTSVKRRNKTSKRNKFSKRTNMKHGGFKIYEDEVIGRGGQGTAIKKVFEIEEDDASADAAWMQAGPILRTDVGKKVCFVKKIYPNFVKHTRAGGNLEKFAHRQVMTEVSLMIELDHVNIIKLYSYGYERRDGSPYIIMDYFNCVDLKHMIKENALVATEPDGGGCSKKTLSDKIGLRNHLFGGGTKRWGVTETTKFFIIKEIFNGMQYLHRNNIIHCDIKPTNIFLNVDTEQQPWLRVVIGDLGHAIEVDDINSYPLTLRAYASGKDRGKDRGEVTWIAGTLPYIPKESKSKLLLTQDYYAFGVLVLQVLLMDYLMEGATTGTNFHGLYLEYISNNTETLEEYEPLLKLLLYEPGDGEEYSTILQKRREAFEGIGGKI